MHAHALLGNMNGKIVQPTVCELLQPFVASCCDAVKIGQ
jgi:hypothetical protein